MLPVMRPPEVRERLVSVGQLTHHILFRIFFVVNALHGRATTKAAVRVVFGRPHLELLFFRFR